MPTQQEELEAVEFLKRAEIHTMKKDLRALREVDALKERDKIAKLKTLDEQLEEKKKSEVAFAQAEAERKGLEKVLTKNEGQERLIEKDLKTYANEEELQKIFLIESARLDCEKHIEQIDKEKDPALKLQKNDLLLQRRDAQAQLDAIIAQEKALEDEQKAIAEKEQTTTIASQKKSLEQARWDLDKKIQEKEKKRWEAEKSIQAIDEKIRQADENSEALSKEREALTGKILGADRQLREIYSVVMVREEEKLRGKTAEQQTQKEALSKVRAQEKEVIQREQWGHLSVPQAPTKKLVQVQKLKESFQQEEEQRKKFMQDVEQSIQPPIKQ